MHSGEQFPEGRRFVMSNKVYDILKFVAQILLPALGTLYLALSKIWGFPYGEEIVGTITAVDLFLGSVLGLSSKKYYEDLENGTEVDTYGEKH